LSARSRVLAAMTVAMVLGYMPWYNFSAVLKYISADFGLSASDTGMILAAFQAGYVIVVPLTGWLADRIGVKKVVFWATLLTGVFSTLFVWGAQDKWSVLVLRLVTGLSAGAIYVPGMALLSRWFPPARRGGALGAYTGALAAAYAGGYFVAAPLAASYGWRTGILWTSLPALVAAAVVLFLVKEAPVGAEVEPASADTARQMQADGLPEALLAPRGGNGGPVLITAGYMGHMWELYAFWGWIGPFMVATALVSGMSAGQAVNWGGMMAALIIVLGAPASWLWGFVADKRGRTWAIMLAGCLSLAVELILGFLYGQPLAIVVVAAAWIGFWGIADSPIYKVGLTEMVLPRLRGTYLGFQSALGFLVTIFAPMIFGVVLQYFNGPGDPTDASIWGPGFAMLGLGALLVPVASLILRRQPQARLLGNGRM
jgi:MFS family permease